MTEANSSGEEMSEQERALLTQLRDVTSHPSLRHILTIRLNEQFGADEFRMALRVALMPDKVHAALAFARLRTPDPFLRKLISYYENKDIDRLKFALRLFEQANYMEDLTASMASTHWMTAERFVMAYEHAKSAGGWRTDPRWRMHVLMTCAERAANQPGDFVECGTDRGGSALCVIGYLGTEAFANRCFYLFDTFQGVVREQMRGEEMKLAGLDEERYPPVLDQVRQNFAEFPFVRIVPGTVPSTLPAFKGDEVAYLHIDMNVAYPEAEALKFFWPRLLKGAPVIFDDYGFPRSEVQRRELDRLTAELGTAITTLPTGQGLLWR